jgi:DNA replication protein DnaD
MNKLVQDFGFGIIPKHIMKNPNISIQAKGIYAYLCSYAGNKDTAFPSVKLITHELSMSKDTFYKYLNELKDTGYIEVSKERTKGRFSKNIYKLLPCPKSSDTTLSDTVSSDTTLSDTVSSDTNINSTNINSINNNSTNKNNYNKDSSNSEEDKKELFDKEFKELAALYQKCGFKVNGLTPDWIQDIKKEYSFEWCKNAFLIAEKRGKLTKSYVEGILKNWNNDGGMKLGGGQGGTDRPSNESDLGQYEDIGITI